MPISPSLVTIGVVASMVFVFIFSVEVEIAFVLYISISQFGEYFSIIFKLRDLPVLFDLLLLLIVAKVVYERLFEVETHPKIAVLVLFLLGIALVELFNPNVISSPIYLRLQGYRRLVFQALAYFIGLNTFRDRKSFSVLLHVFLITVSPILIYGIKQSLWGYTTFDWELAGGSSPGSTYSLYGTMRAFGFYASPFMFGAVSVLVYLMSLYFIRLYGGKWYYYSSLILGILGVFLSLTRSSIISLLISSMIFAVLSQVKINIVRMISRALGLLFSLLLIVAIGLFFIPQISYVLRSFLTISTDLHFLQRIDNYEKMFQLILRNPILGYGTGSGGSALHLPATVSVDPHNLVLYIFIELGISGLFVFLAIYYSLLKDALIKLRQLRKNGTHKSQFLFPSLAIASLSIIFTMGLTGNGLDIFPVNVWFWFISGNLSLWIGTVKIVCKNQANSSQPILDFRVEG